VLHISDIPVDERIEILDSPETVIATVGIVREEVAPAPEITEEAPAEPELIGKGKKEEEEGGEES
jgi:large subunit ribosomal protein L25